MVVAGIFSFTLGSHDTVATYLVSKNCRFVQWGRTYSWNANTEVGLDTVSLAKLPANRLMDNLRYWLYNNRPRLTFSDLAPLAYLFDKQVWKSTDMVKVSSRLVVQPASDITFDFLDIPPEANDWNRYQTEFFSTMLNADLFQSKHLPAAFDAEAYAGHSGTGLFFLGPTTGPSGVAFPVGAWADYKLTSPNAKKYAITILCRSAAGGRLSVGWPGQSPLAEIEVPASTAWSVVKSEIDFGKAGNQVLRISSVRGQVDLDHLEIQ
jgi:hypothetical protein